MLREKNAPNINQKLKVTLQQYSVFSRDREGSKGEVTGRSMFLSCYLLVTT